ncbi:hypothetical protein BBO99_00006549 [Phytophthora kernoviae]|uniref:PX domain-containing protein n=2 Tax=Phytophthora kernoviae TaxID=325452 RepID=A0A421GKH4_9STRA|nr:hypothetical protein G195_008092 [Phytophthora kernoviae 00238/432]KAG2520293.1 hypothetical protein JM16_006773 [Phytophthora kernoviae]KAG2521124.1 hypothetical protein JM18_006639 [Phytophthora kernoviae]RLN13834.1 hypothetical protein BBI17_006584 [Phytophthora kernoviae]RLN77693.1 hypothetical protein BBO99_00006549 [Phytophthora kernoviae]
MSLNEIYRIHICSSYIHEDGATVYVVNVFLKKTQKGLPTVETLSQRKRRLRHEQKLMAPDYQVEHRYSDFRAMVKSISAVVNDHDHFRFCAYCSRVGTTKSAAGFPSRVPSRGPVRQLVTRIRKSRLEHFVNQMLKAAKDNSYRSGSNSDEADELPQRYRMSTQSLSRLSRLSTIAKFAMKLNQIHHIRICSTYDDGSGAIVYVLNVYLRYVQKGLPPVTPRRESERQRKKRLQLQRDTERPMYQVEHRYSAFRELKRHIVKTVNARGEHRHLMQCAYCSRVKFIDSSATFPPRVLSRGLVAKVTGWQQVCTQFRKRQLESFVNQLLMAAKDLSYRTGSGQCERFLVVSQILNSFLSEPSMRAAVW